MNSYLTPLVEELLEFWNGVIIPVPVNGSTMHIRVRVALTCIACDIPASRKVCGFVGHNAKLGCNKCFKEFEMVDHKTDFSGFDRNNWTLRTNEDHRRRCSLLDKEVTPTSLQSCESSLGVRYSILLALPYFDPIRFTVIDPMHNLFLGTGKYMFKIWIEQGLLRDNDLARIENNIRSFKVPAGEGRLPYNIVSGHSGFTANQWSNWITIYSPVVLKGILPNSHFCSWLLFVRACSIMRARTLKKQDIVSADLYLLEFCRSFQELYGSAVVTPNLHLHVHLKQSMLDFGPPHAFWCYAFERYNGILGSVHTNRRSIESQLMRKFCQQQELNSLSLPNDQEFHSFLPYLHNEPKSISISIGCLNDADISACLAMSRSPLSNISSFIIKEQNLVKLLPPFQENVLTATYSKQLQQIYEQLYPTFLISHFPLFYKEFGRVEIAGDIVGSVKRGQNSRSSSVVMGYWPGTGDKLDAINYGHMRVGAVQFFIKHTISVKNSPQEDPYNITHIFGYIHWKKSHPHETRYGISATLCTDLIEDPGACCFMPVQRIACRCAYSQLLIDFSTHKETVFVACPIPLKYAI